MDYCCIQRGEVGSSIPTVMDLVVDPVDFEWEPRWTAQIAIPLVIGTHTLHCAGPGRGGLIAVNMG